jgi:hypothetical protein
MEDLGHHTFLLLTELEDRRVEMADGGRGIKARVERGRRVDRAMSQDTPNDLVPVGMLVEKELRRGMSKQMRMKPHAGVRVDCIADLLAERVAPLWSPALAEEQSGAAGRFQPWLEPLDIALDQRDALRRERIFQRLVVFHFSGLDDDVRRFAAARANEVPFEIEVDEIADPERGHQRRRR